MTIGISPKFSESTKNSFPPIENTCFWDLRRWSPKNICVCRIFWFVCNDGLTPRNYLERWWRNCLFHHHESWKKIKLRLNTTGRWSSLIKTPLVTTLNLRFGSGYRDWGLWERTGRDVVFHCFCVPGDGVVYSLLWLFITKLTFWKTLNWGVIYY